MACEAPFASDAGRQALTASARAIEEQSGAEVLIAVRARSAHYLHTHLLAGVAAGTATLWFQLFSPWEFSLVSILLAPLVVGVAVGFATEGSPALQRLLTAAAIRRSTVRTAAQAAFVELGVGETRGRTGMLVYVSCMEKALEIVLDQELRPVSAVDGWAAAVDEVKAAVARDDAARAAEALRRLAPLVAGVVPRGADDVNELADAVSVA